MAYKVVLTYDAKSLFFWLWRHAGMVDIVFCEYSEISNLTPGKVTGPYLSQREANQHLRDVFAP